ELRGESRFARELEARAEVPRLLEERREAREAPVGARGAVRGERGELAAERARAARGVGGALARGADLARDAARLLVEGAQLRARLLGVARAGAEDREVDGEEVHPVREGGEGR